MASCWRKLSVSMKDTPARADHHKDDISVDFDRVCCQILDDSIAVGETETIHFLLGRFSVLLWSERRKVERRIENRKGACRGVAEHTYREREGGKER